MGMVGAATAASLCFGNAGYLYLTVSFVQILKVPTIVAARRKLAPVALLMNILQAFTPVFVVAMLYCTSIETPSRRVCFAVRSLPSR